MTFANDVTLDLPRTWFARRDLAHGVVLAARPHSAAMTGVPPEIVLRCVPVTLDLTDWRDQALADLGAQLPDFTLEQDAEIVLGRHRVRYSRFGHRLGTACLLCEQWSWLVDGVGVTLTCTAEQEDHRSYRDLFGQVASTVDVRPRLAS